MTNTYLKSQPAGIQFMALMGLTLGFFVVGVLLSNFLFPDLSNVLENSQSVITPEIVARFKWAQLISAVISFIMPALLFGYYSSEKPFEYIGMHKQVSVLLLILCVFLLFAVQPFVGWLGNVNAKIHFGRFHEALKDIEEKYNRALETFLRMKSPTDLIVNLVVMALLPAIGEELFFRGSLLRVLLRWSKIPWLSILISSLVFAVLHGTFFKILPIFTLGLMLGTVYYVTKNLWYCILIHFLNNATAVLAVYYADRSEVIKKFANDSMAIPLFLVLLSLLVTPGIIYMMKKNSEPQLPELAIDEYNDGAV